MNIEDLYAKIPKFKCIPNCHDCCGPVPIVPEEALKLQLNVKSQTIPFNIGNLKCDYESNKGCKIYDNRPFLCRLYGTVSSLKCTKGGKPERILTEAEESELLNDYFKLKQFPI
jgi:hypothetical protein